MWRHSCVSFNRESGRMRLVENGALWRDETTPEVVEAMRKVRNSASIFTLGCMYWNSVNEYMAMYGSVTDAQVFGRALSDEEMIGITSCNLDLQGDILNWETAKWTLKSPNNFSEKEVLDLEQDLCVDYSHSLVLVPQHMQFREGLHQCSKLSGRLADYTEKAEFDEITHFLAKRENSFSGHCSSGRGEDGRMVEVSLAVSDEKVETNWTTWEGNRVVNYLPWAENRPTKNGEANNCLLLKVRYQLNGNPECLLKVSINENERPHMSVDTNATDVIDESCFSFLCPVCVIEEASMVFQLRGLCLESVFSRRFTFMITEEGQIRYLGDTTSMIHYNWTSLVWLMNDRRESAAKAVSTALETSMLIGMQTFDFTGVPNDVCTAGGTKDKIVRVKLTSCKEGQFTCSDGQCVSMEQRCDQIAQCRDQSDEEDCRWNRKIFFHNIPLGCFR